MLEKEKPIHIITAALLIIAVSTIAVAEYFGLPVHKTLTDRQVFCTQEAKLCPDGSAVSRTGPNCEFAACAKTVVEQADTSDWKTYRNEEYGFEVGYPEGWYLRIPSPQRLELESPDLQSCSGDVCVPQDILILVESYQANLDLATFVRTSREGWFSNYYREAKVVIDDREGIKVSDVGSHVEHVPLEAVFIPLKENEVIIFRLHGYTMEDNAELLSIWEQILSTFKFIQ